MNACECRCHSDFILSWGLGIPTHAGSHFQEEENRTVSGVRRYPVDIQLNVPVDNKTAEAIMQNNRDIYNLSHFQQPDWNSNIEVGQIFSLQVGPI